MPNEEEEAFFSAIDEDSTESSEEEVEPLQWDLIHSFESEEFLPFFLQNEKCWSTRSTQTLKSGFKTLLRCNLIPVSNPNQCAASMYTLRKTIVLDGEEEKIVYQVFRNNREHTHNLNANV